MVKRVLNSSLWSNTTGHISRHFSSDSFNHFYMHTNTHIDDVVNGETMYRIVAMPKCFRCVRNDDYTVLMASGWILYAFSKQNRQIIFARLFFILLLRRCTFFSPLFCLASTEFLVSLALFFFSFISALARIKVWAWPSYFYGRIVFMFKWAMRALKQKVWKNIFKIWKWFGQMRANKKNSSDVTTQLFF